MPEQIKQILFSLNPEPRMSGGVRKMLDYVGHAQSFADYRPFVHFPPHLIKPGVENVYLRHLEASLLIDDISMLRPDLVFSFLTPQALSAFARRLARRGAHHAAATRLQGHGAWKAVLP